MVRGRLLLLVFRIMCHCKPLWMTMSIKIVAVKCAKCGQVSQLHFDSAGRPPAVQCLFKLQHVLWESVLSKAREGRNSIFAVKSREAMPGGGLREDLWEGGQRERWGGCTGREDCAQNQAGEHPGLQLAWILSSHFELALNICLLSGRSWDSSEIKGCSTGCNPGNPLFMPLVRFRQHLKKAGTDQSR